MKILLVSESYWPNADGGALFERRLVKGLIARGNEVAVWAPATRYANCIEHDENYDIYRERAATFWANPRYKVSYWPFWHGRKIIKSFKPDVIHIHGPGMMGLAGFLWAKYYKIPVVSTNHFMPENALLNLVSVKSAQWLYKPLHSLIWKYLVWFNNRADLVTSPTPTAVKLLVDHGLKIKSRPISNGIDMSIFKPDLDTSRVIKKYNIATNKPVLIYVGRLDGEKRLDLIISALPEIIAHLPVQLIFVGAGKAMPALKKQAERLGVRRDIIFTGYVEETEKPIIYNTADIFVISSPAELQSIVTLEAMASGLPIISVDVAALKELCHNGENGYLFPENDYQSLSSKVLQLLSDKKVLSAFGKESLSIVKKNHSTDVTFKLYEDAYKEVLQSKRNVQ